MVIATTFICCVYKEKMAKKDLPKNEASLQIQKVSILDLGRKKNNNLIQNKSFRYYNL